MPRYILAFVISIHGFIHFMGFAKAFDYGDIKQLSIPISKPIGMLWLLSAFLLIATTAFLLLRKEYWWMIALAAIALSQIVIAMNWKDARFGTVANIIILVAAILSYSTSHFENVYHKDISDKMKRSDNVSLDLLTEADTRQLPIPVQRYLKYAGVFNKPKVKNVRIVFEGKMSEKGKDYFPFTSEQFNFFENPARLFFMKARMFGVIVPGYHRYRNATATMDIRLFGIIPVAQKSGIEMNKAETVTLFNDMCILAPATLIDKRIKWEAMDAHAAKATFTNQGIVISAILYFNEQGQLVNFVSDDRHAPGMGGEYTFSTPIISYQEISGYHLMKEGDAVWHYPEGKFTYGKFYLKQIEYNVVR